MGVCRERYLHSYPSYKQMQLSRLTKSHGGGILLSVKTSMNHTTTEAMACSDVIMTAGPNGRREALHPEPGEEPGRGMSPSLHQASGQKREAWPPHLCGMAGWRGGFATKASLLQVGVSKGGRGRPCLTAGIKGSRTTMLKTPVLLCLTSPQLPHPHLAPLPERALTVSGVHGAPLALLCLLPLLSLAQEDELQKLH